MAGKCSVMVVGVGNRLFGDDGLGSCVAEALRSCGRGQGVCVTALERMGPGDLWVFDVDGLVVFIDVVEDERLEPGGIGVYEIDPRVLDTGETVEAIQGIDPHEIDPARLALLAHAAGVLRARVLLVGVRGYAYRFGSGVSPQLLEKAPRLVSVLERLLADHGYGFSVDHDCLQRLLKDCTKPP